MDTIERKEAILFHTITKNNSNIIHNALCRSKKNVYIAPLQKLLSCILFSKITKKSFKNKNQIKIGTD